jgi:NAD(P)-dependent dehydrogenase (short-subunit alcohol dehydrogenase family)
MSRLDGKFVLITGASRGLGRQLALDFTRAGAAGLALVARSGDALREVRDRVRDISPQARVVAITADLGREEDVERVVAATLYEFGGRLDVLVNNASVLGPAPMPYLLDYPLEDFRVLGTNLNAPFLLIKKVLPAMVEHGGSIINVTSNAGSSATPAVRYGISSLASGMSQTQPPSWRAAACVSTGSIPQHEHRDAPGGRSGRGPSQGRPGRRHRVFRTSPPTNRRAFTGGSRLRAVVAEPCCERCVHFVLPPELAGRESPGDAGSPDGVG